MWSADRLGNSEKSVRYGADAFSRAGKGLVGAIELPTEKCRPVLGSPLAGRRPEHVASCACIPMGQGVTCGGLTARIDGFQFSGSTRHSCPGA